MTKLISSVIFFSLMVLISTSCHETCDLEKSRELRSSIEKYSMTFIEDLTASDWAERCKVKYGWEDDWIAQHQIFRNAFPDYNIEVKRMLIDSLDVTIWGEVSGTHSKEFPMGELKGHTPRGEKITWNEVWCFDIVVDSTGMRFGEKWDMVIDGVDRMKKLGIKCLPGE